MLTLANRTHGQRRDAATGGRRIQREGGAREDAMPIGTAGGGSQPDPTIPGSGDKSGHATAPDVGGGATSACIARPWTRWTVTF